MWLKKISLLMVILLAGCGHYFVEPQPVSQKEQPPKKTEIVHMPKQKIIKTIDNVNQQVKKKVQDADALFFEEKYDLAYVEYASTLRIDPDNIPATIGLSKCFLKDNQYEQAFSALQRIENSVRHTRYAPEYYFLYIQTYTNQSNWDNTQLKKIKDAYYYALPAYRKQPELYYYMGLIYNKVYQYNKAKTYFSKVVSYGGTFKESAYNMINQIKEREQCELCEYHQKLPLIPQITRADMCYILHHDLDIHELFQKTTHYTFRPKPQIARDIANHPLKQEIEALLLMDLLGLSLFPNNGFQPEMPLTRADFAQIIFEIINRVKPQAVHAFHPQENSGGIADVHPTQHYFRAILFCTSHLIMPPLETGEFDPYGAVSGADALMSIRTLKQFFVQQFK